MNLNLLVRTLLVLMVGFNLNGMQKIMRVIPQLVCASFNISADYFDKRQPEINHWDRYRYLAVKTTIEQRNPHILAIQEASSKQCFELSEFEQYESVFLSQTPSDIPAGVIVQGNEVKEWLGKDTGTAIVGIMFKKDKFEMLDKGRFWLNENPNTVPTNTDRSITDKGFGNMNTYRAVLWIKLKDIETNQNVFIFNSHYPLSGNHDTRFKCAEVERKMIEEITAGEFWISLGDRNIIPEKDSSEKCDMNAMRPLLDGAYWGFNRENHSGPLTTFVGFPNDFFKNPIVDDTFAEVKIFDVTVSNREAISSAHVLTQYDPDTNKIEFNPSVIDQRRCFASDHLYVETIYPFPICG